MHYAAAAAQQRWRRRDTNWKIQKAMQPRESLPWEMLVLLALERPRFTQPWLQTATICPPLLRQAPTTLMPHSSLGCGTVKTSRAALSTLTLRTRTHAVPLPPSPCRHAPLLHAMSVLHQQNITFAPARSLFCSHLARILVPQHFGHEVRPRVV